MKKQKSLLDFELTSNETLLQHVCWASKKKPYIHITYTCNNQSSQCNLYIIMYKTKKIKMHLKMALYITFFTRIMWQSMNLHNLENKNLKHFPSLNKYLILSNVT